MLHEVFVIDKIIFLGYITKFRFLHPTLSLPSYIKSMEIKNKYVSKPSFIVSIIEDDSMS
jgi:hypothetical protein